MVLSELHTLPPPGEKRSRWIKRNKLNLSCEIEEKNNNTKENSRKQWQFIIRLALSELQTAHKGGKRTKQTKT